MVLSFQMSHSDIAFVVKFKFNEGGSEIGGGAVLHHGASASWLIYQDIVFASGLFIWDQWSNLTLSMNTAACFK